MAQRDKVKELVGRGLNSYHTKALQQMDRIENKNKEQNHKISILSNELDNDYLTKTEEGSVISLEHSKEGMVYLDELQGNTLVNYCTDGSKEMTLNGDIDVEGTFVTTTEGVDNGKVDVLCEGNTLVNLFTNISLLGKRGYSYDVNTKILSTKANGIDDTSWTNVETMFDVKKNSKYTFLIECLDENVRYQIRTNDVSDDAGGSLAVGLNICIFTAQDTSFKFKFFDAHRTSLKRVKNIMLLEGDWTNKELPPYFEGMKSVGQDDTNGHKIEILSQNKNLCTVNSYSGVRHNKIETNIPCKKNTIYTLTFKDESDLNQSGSRGITLITHKTKTYKNDHGSIYTYAMGEGGKEYTFRESGFTFNTSDCCYISLTSNNMASVPNLIIKEIQIEEGSQTSYSPHTFNKKEILINEPLRSVPNGVKDRIVKIGGKYFIERNCKQVRLELKSGALFEELETEDTIVAGIWNYSDKKYHKKNIINHINDTFTDVDDRNNQNEYIHSDGWNTNFFIRIKKSRLTENTLQGVKNWLQNNPINLVYELATPTYEPLEIEPTLNTYNDITHISNNSIIPCTMKIKNTGYNAIIKPSTLYTVAIGTDKGGTIGMSLGGTKVTTTNNVAKITTPATLTDDSLRLYGKGRKGSKIRILEGDIVNIPKHFTGIQSSFEDKVQEDGTYKMEVLSNNENLFRLEDIKYSTLAGNSARPIKNGFKIITDTVHYWHAVVSMELNVKPKTTYTLGVSKKVVINAYPSQEPSWGAGYVFIREYGDKVLTEGKVKDNTRTYFRFNSGENTKIRVTFATATDVATQKGEYDFTDLDLRESKSNLEYVDNKYNKIQFSSIEPLRSTTDISDRFIFKDGKIMIERNCIERDLTYFKFTTTEIKGLNLRGGITISDAYRQPQGGSNTTMKCDKLASSSKEGIIPCINIYHHTNSNELRVSIPQRLLKTMDINGINDYFANNPHKVIYRLAEPYYEEIPFELQKIILEGYENGTLFFDTNIPPTSTVTYAGETPIVKVVKLNKTEVSNNTDDINDNIIPYLCDMDYRVVMLQLATEELEGGVSMARLFGGTYEMIKRDILSKRLTREEYGHRLADYFNAGKLTEEQVRELEELR